MLSLLSHWRILESWKDYPPPPKKISALGLKATFVKALDLRLLHISYRWTICISLSNAYVAIGFKFLFVNSRFWNLEFFFFVCISWHKGELIICHFQQTSVNDEKRTEFFWYFFNQWSSLLPRLLFFWLDKGLRPTLMLSLSLLFMRDIYKTKFSSLLPMGKIIVIFIMALKAAWPCF